jgi:hypothetical protein
LRVAAHRKLKKVDLNRAIWQTGADARVWRLSLRSMNAVGVRLHFSHFAVGDGQVWIHDTQNPPAQVFGPYTGNGRNGDGDFWTEIIFSDAVEIEYVPAAGSSAGGRPPFEISELSHLWEFGGKVARRKNAASPGFTVLAGTAETPKNFSCFRNTTCYTSYNTATVNSTAADHAASSTAFIVYGDSTGAYQCSGTMLNAVNQSPIVLTAGHCIQTQEQARSMVAVFRVFASGCGQPASVQPTVSQLAAAPQSVGDRLLSFSNRPFLRAGSDQELHNDLDYALVLLKSLPNWAGVGFSGYDASGVSPGQNLFSVSAPYGLSLKAAFGAALPSSWDYGFEFDQTTNGRVGPGSSGSGAFDTEGRLVGVLSTGPGACDDPSTCPNATVCDVNGTYAARYTSFSAIYPFIREYLLPSATPVGAATTDPAIFSASQIRNVNGAGYGDATLTINALSKSPSVEIHVASPDGPLFYAGSSIGTAVAAGWVNDGTSFYLQDASRGQVQSAANTIAVAVARTDSPLLTANPPFIPFADKDGNGSLTLNWNVPGARLLELHVASPDGPLVAFGGSPVGWARVEGWAADGMKFVLCEVSNGSCSAQNTVATFTAKVEDLRNDRDSQADFGSRSLVAFPNPIAVTPGQTAGQTTLYWRAPEVAEVQLHVRDANGPLMAIGGSGGSASTGVWVEDGMRFCITDRSGNELASVVVHVAK